MAEDPASSRIRVRPALKHAALFALAYFAGSELGYSLSLGPSVGGTFWPPSGISLAAFVASPFRTWPLLILAGAVANFTSDVIHGQILPASIGFTMANLAEPVLGAFLIRRALSARVMLTRLGEIGVLAVVVVFASTPVAAAFGAFIAERFTPDPPGFVAGWQTWWIGDLVGALVVAPFALRLITGWERRGAIPARTWIEAGAFGAAVWSVTHVVFAAPPASVAMPFLVFPVLLWGSLRLGVIAVGAALCLVVALTAQDTAAGLGPFAAQHLSLADRLIALQIYVGVMALTFHGLAILWEERMQTSAALRLAHSGLAARHRRIVEQAPLGIVAVDVNGRVLDLNPAWERLWGAGDDHSRVAAEPWLDPGLAALLTRAFTGEVVELPEREVLIPGQTSGRRVRGFAYPVKDEKGGVPEVVLIEQDITEQVRARRELEDANDALRDREEALSHALREMAAAQQHREQLLGAERSARAEAERASQLKDEFLATLSHELRTPLNAILGWAQILQASAKDSPMAPAVDTIFRNARVQAKLIEDLLDMSRIVAGKVALTKFPARLADIVTGAFDTLRPVAEAKGVALSQQSDGADDLWLPCDAQRLQQVVTNLLDNGIKFTPAGGRVEVRVTTRLNEAQIIVADTGQGIPAAFLPAVFERFRQADGSTTRRHGGLGLGLSIARQIVEMHGGSIRVESEGPGLGAVFTVTLPLDNPEVDTREDARPVEPSVSLAGLRVMVVDDDADARELLRRLLIERGGAVTCAGSAEEALQALSAADPDVLLTDIGMPDVDGYELLRRVRTGTHAAIKAIAVTAFARPEDRERALAAGFDDHLTKPIDGVLLLRTLASVTAPAGTPSHE